MTTRTADNVLPRNWEGSAAALRRCGRSLRRRAPAAPSPDLLSAAAMLLRERGREFVAAPTLPLEFDLELRGTAVLAALRASGFSRRIVLKSSALNVGIREACALQRALRLIAASNPRLASGLPTILGADAETGMLVMEHVEGEHLLARLRRECGSPRDSAATRALFAEAAVLLAAVHRLPAAEMLPAMPVRRQRSFVPQFLHLAASFTAAFRRAGFARPEQLLDRLSSEFFNRPGDRVLLVDARPKNMLIRPAGGLCFFDLDCQAAPAGVGLGAFVAALDRFGSRYPGDSAQARLAAWKRTFVRAYCDAAGGPIGEDLTFFYPWTLLQMYDQHSRQRPWMRSYFHWYYGRRLEAFLRPLAATASAHAAAAPAVLFEQAA